MESLQVWQVDAVLTAGLKSPQDLAGLGFMALLYSVCSFCIIFYCRRGIIEKAAFMSDKQLIMTSWDTQTSAC